MYQTSKALEILLLKLSLPLQRARIMEILLNQQELILAMKVITRAESSQYVKIEATALLQLQVLRVHLPHHLMKSHTIQ